MTMHRIFLCLQHVTLVVALAAFSALAPAAERVLYQKISQYNTIIVSEDEHGMRVLRFEPNGARQSMVKPGDPTYLGFAYTRVAFSGLALTPEPRRMLVIGLGGGTMPMFLRNYYPVALIDVVDVDGDVVQVAKDYFGFREDERLRAHVADGRKFIEAVREPYDVVFLDAFGARSVPAHLTTVEFVRAARRAVKPTGVVISNVWGRLVNPLYDSMVRTYQEVFEEVYILEVPGTSNRILLALPRRQTIDRAQFVQMASRTGAEKRFAFDPGNIEEQQFTHATRKLSNGHVLRDAGTVQPSPAPVQ